MKKQKTKETDFTTDTGVSINKRIEEGDTILVYGIVEAIKVVKVTKTYYYDVYVNGKTCGKYAIPVK